MLYAFIFQPGHYLGHLIGHEGKGSLLSELKLRGKFGNLFMYYNILTAPITRDNIR